MYYEKMKTAKKNKDLIKTIRNFLSVSNAMILLLSIHVLCACGTGSKKTNEPEPSKGAVPGTKEPEPTKGTMSKKYESYFTDVCEYTYEQNNKDKYVTMLTDFYNSDSEGKILPKANPNKYAVIQKYLELWNNYYPTDIDGSEIQIFKGKEISDVDLLGTKLQKNENLKINITDKAYEYKNNEAFVDFANERIGGGALGNGFVQEEIEMIESTFLPWLTQIPKSNSAKTSLSWCPQVDLRKLNIKPALMRFRIIFKVQDGVYGDKLKDIKPEKVPDILKKRDENADIYSIALAAVNFGFKNPKPYDSKNLRQMTLAATRAFLDTMLAMHADNVPIIIHTGNWGAGAFNGNIHTVYAMQAIAVAAAYEQFKNIVKSSPEVKFFYDAFGQNSMNKANTAKIWLDKEPSGMSVEGQINRLLQEIEAKPNGPSGWQTGQGK